MPLDQVLNIQPTDDGPIHSATINRVVSATEVYVVAPSFSDGEYGPVNLIGEVSFSVGDSCLLVFDSELNPWAVGVGDRAPLDSALSGSPSDGEIAFVNASGVTWQLRYKASTGWQFVGGSPLQTNPSPDASNQISHNSTTATAWSGKSITVPFAGSYDVSFGAHMKLVAAGDGQCQVRLYKNTTDTTYLVAARDSDASAYVVGASTVRLTGLAANDAINLYYWSNASYQIWFGWMTVVPVTLT